jgi:hypothetical protein
MTMSGVLCTAGVFAWFAILVTHWRPNQRWWQPYVAAGGSIRRFYWQYRKYWPDIIGITALVIALWPRIQVDFSEVYEADSPFPASVTISNQFLPLHDVELFVRFCNQDAFQGLTIEGGSDCTRSNTGRGGFRMGDWTSQLARDDKWTVPLGRNVQVTMPARDVLFVIKYWPWPIPSLSTIFSAPEYVARFSLFRRDDGSLIWIRKPLDP